MARLILATAEGPQSIELRPINSLGRHPNNSIQLLDKIVSKEHCIVELRDGQFILRDLGSLNGTYINNERVRGEQPLKHGDEIALGATRARYDDGSGAALDPPQASPGVAVHQAGSGPWPAAQPPMQQQPGMMYSQGPVPQQPTGAAPMPPRPNAPPMAPQYPMSQPARPPQMQPPMQGGTGTAAMQAYPGQMGPMPGQPVGGVGQQPFRPPHRPPSFSGTRVDVLDSARAIGTEIAAQTKGFLPFDKIPRDSNQLGVDYERLRVAWELTREIGLERDLDRLLEKILSALFKFVRADRGVILLREGDRVQGAEPRAEEFVPRAARRADGSEAPIQISSTILNHVIKERKSVITHDASMDFASSKGKSMILNRISSAIVIPLLHESEVLGVLWLDSESLAVFQQKDLEIITSVGNQAAMFIENTLLARKIEQEIITRERFSRLLSPNIAEQVAAGKLEVKKGGVLVPECTVFNSDIRGFTSMSEGARPDLLVDMLNDYFEEMVNLIFKYEGTLDKFMGDGIMAIWGAPAVHPDDAVRSVQSGLEQMECLGIFNRRRLERELPPLAIGIGIHTGPLVAGYVGSSKALSYTVIGDTANTSARLCGIANAGQIIVSEPTLAKLGNRFEVEELPPAQLKGKEKALRIFNVKRERPSAASRTP